MSEPETNPCRSEKEIFFEVIEKATPEERLLCLDGACGKDPLLRKRVETLLENHFQEDSFMKEPAVESSPTAVVPAPLSGVPGTITTATSCSKSWVKVDSAPFTLRSKRSR